MAYKELLCLAAVKLDGKWGFIDKAGKFVIEPLYGYVGKFCEGRVSFTKGSLSFKTVPYSHGPGLCSGFYSNCLWGYLDTEGKILVEPSFEEASDFSEGMARVGIDGMFGFVSKDGRIAIEPRFLEARKFDGGLSIVLVEGRWEIDKDSDIGSRMLVHGLL